MGYKKFHKPKALLNSKAALERLLTPEQVSELTGLAEQTLARYRVSGGGPAFIRISARCIRYRESDLRAWIEAKAVLSTSEAAAAI
ncbi:MAG: helix-turn-helix transcriptional regulator [Ferrovibrio sp.]|uniref:helix-turn-helix transcriptional regulator n=1 Tax=Ferrovibrio sp. TaxID=1917215 RepID=UPI00391DFF5E